MTLIRTTLPVLTLLLGGAVGSLAAQTLGRARADQRRPGPPAHLQGSGPRLPVKLRGVVLEISEPRPRAVIIADETGGLYLLANGNQLANYNRGDLLEVTGVSDPGQFAPIVKISQARKIGTSTNPPPRTVSYHELLTGALDAQWVELTGVVRRYLPPETNSSIFRVLVAADGGVVSVRGYLPRDPNLKEDAEVRVQAICLYQFNQKRQVLTPILQLPSSQSLQVLKPAPADPYAIPLRAADSLLQFSPGHATRPSCPGARRGHPRATRRDDLDSRCLRRVANSNAPERNRCRRAMRLMSSASRSMARFRPCWMKPSSARPARIISSPRWPFTNVSNVAFDHEDDLVQATALLKDMQRVVDGLVFTFDMNGTVFRATLKTLERKREHPEWLPGSKIRVTGICSLIHDDIRPMMGVWQPQAFQLLIRSPADLEFCSPPALVDAATHHLCPGPRLRRTLDRLRHRHHDCRAGA
jgi:hypothetical protein